MSNETSGIILDTVEKEKPENVEHLIQLLKLKLSIPESAIIDEVIRLQTEGRLVLKKPLKPIPRDFASYLKTRNAGWYWMTILLTAAATIAAYTVPADVFPLAYARNILGTVLVIFLPGYGLTKALFPSTPPLKTSSATLDGLEILIISVGLSMALVPMVGLMLGYTTWGLNQITSVSSLFVLTIVLATIAVVRQHQTRMNRLQ